MQLRCCMASTLQRHYRNGTCTSIKRSSLYALCKRPSRNRRWCSKWRNFLGLKRRRWGAQEVSWLLWTGVLRRCPSGAGCAALADNQSDNPMLL